MNSYMKSLAIKCTNAIFRKSTEESNDMYNGLKDKSKVITSQKQLL